MHSLIKKYFFKTKSKMNIKKSHSNLIQLKSVKNCIIFFKKKVKDKLKKSHGKDFFNQLCSQYQLFQSNLFPTTRRNYIIVNICKNQNKVQHKQLPSFKNKQVIVKIIHQINMAKFEGVSYETTQRCTGQINASTNLVISL